ncbi:hypothetical protein [Saccharothrix sp. Mg75]|uniref:hypothetical protein n=1 Tax=Saccharothrix sp. Mg75 TaxID=3445357 RepID=UPI003EEAF24D
MSSTSITSASAADTGDPLLLLRHLRLTPAADVELGEHLRGLVDEAEDAGGHEFRHGVLVALYREP